MSNRAVIGLGFGDEGKGVVTEYLCSQDPEHTVVVRFSGGQQAGHKVCKGDTEHIFSNFGSGTLSGCPTYWSEHCTFGADQLLTSIAAQACFSMRVVFTIKGCWFCRHLGFPVDGF